MRDTGYVSLFLRAETLSSFPDAEYMHDDALRQLHHEREAIAFFFDRRQYLVSILSRKLKMRLEGFEVAFSF